MITTPIAMGKLILAINAGSSSVKVSVYKGSSKDVEPPMLADISVAGLTAPPATLTYKRGDESIKGKEIDGVDSQESAFEYVLEHLLNDDGLPELKQKEDIEFACHRIVHGGDYDHAVRIDRDTYHHLEALSDLAPLYETPPSFTMHPLPPNPTILSAPSNPTVILPPHNPTILPLSPNLTIFPAPDH